MRVRLLAIGLIGAVMLAGVGPIGAQPAAAPAAAAAAPVADRSPGATLAVGFSTLTGIAISPLLASGAYGAYRYYTTPEEERGALPWFARMGFWLPALLIAGVCAAKDASGAVLPPGWKKPFDVLETMENQLSALIAAGVAIPLSVIGLAEALAGMTDAPAGPMALMQAGGWAMLAGLPLATSELVWSVLLLPTGLVVFGLVWMASHAINGLILLSPWGAIDAVLKLARVGVLALVGLAAALNPWAGAALSLVIVVIAYFAAGWSFRLTVFATVVSWDVLGGRGERLTVRPGRDRVFSAGRLAGVPTRSYGRVRAAASGGWQFVYRPWLCLPERSAPLPAAARLWVGRGLFFSMVEAAEGGVLFLTPRYRGHEEALVAAYGFAGVRPVGLRRAWAWIRESLGWGRGEAAA